MTEEEILELGVKPKKTRAKSITKEELDAMFARRDEQLNKRLEAMESKCDTCAHHDCDCPERIDDLTESSERRMDKLDENDEALRQGINRLANVTDEQIKALAEQSKGTLEALSKSNADMESMQAMLNEETRLRAATESTVTSLRADLEEQQDIIEEQNEMLAEYKHLLDRNSGDTLKLGILAAVAGAVALVLLGLSVGGLL